MTKYACIIADPPWQYDDAMAAMKSTGNGASSQYHTMPFQDICGLSVVQDGQRVFRFDKDYAVADNAHLWLWITNPFLVLGYGSWLCDKWGFTPKTMATWVKGRLDVENTDDAFGGKLVQHYAQGRYLRGTTEHCILAVRGALPALVHDLPSAFVHSARWPGRLHSEKPPDIHQWAERLSPGPRLELFARRVRPGWDGVGDQLGVIQ